MMDLIWTAVIGLVVGMIARFLHPGKENMGIFMTALLGMAGSLAAGFIGNAVGWYKPGQGAGWIASTLMAVLLLVIYGKVKKPAVQIENAADKSA